MIKTVATMFRLTIIVTWRYIYRIKCNVC